MGIAGRLWRVLKGRSGDLSDVDPSELLRQLERQHRRSQAQKAPPPKPPKPPKKAEATELQQAYARLELPYGASVDEAKKSWRRLMRKYHPDLFLDNERQAAVAEQVASAITEAFQVIEKSGS